LYPFSESDSELVEQFCFAASRKDFEKMKRLQEMSSVLKELRTAEILKASPALEADDFKVAQKLGIQLNLNNNGLMPSIERLIAENLEITIPTNMSPEKYIEIILPHKSKLTKIIRELAENSQNDGGKISLGKLIGEIGSINEQIRKAQKSRRYAALQASVGLVSNNPFMIGSLLAAGGVGLCSSMLGCDAGLAIRLSGGAMATTGVAKIAAKVSKAKLDSRVVQYKDRVLQDLKQQFTGFMSTYLQMDIRALQVWQARKDLKIQASKN